MPTYAYRCQNCGTEFEKYQKFADKPVSKCPKCGKGPVRRLLQPPAIVFKGSGWYATDNRSPSGNGSKSDNGDKSEKAEKADKREKGEKSEKTEKSEAASSHKSDSDSKPAKNEGKAASGGESASSS